LQWLCFAVTVPCSASSLHWLLFASSLQWLFFAVTVTCSDCSLQWLLISMLSKLCSTEV
jgi:hypothetical protein